MFWIPNITTILLAWVVQCIILSGYVWFDKLRIPEESYDCWLIKGLRAFIFIFLTVFAFIFIDTNIKIIFYNVEGYGNISLHLASIILTFLLSAEILIGVLLVAPNRKGIITFIAVLSCFIYLSQFYLVSANDTQLDFFGTKYSALLIILVFPIFVGILTALILILVEILLKKAKSNDRLEDKPFWNIQLKAKKIFDTKFNIILWALISTELILNLQGMSLLLWLTIFI
ncbi:MAG: hypothetical protein ACTSQJ_06675 [Promethearchaeota archaeon]